MSGFQMQSPATTIPDVVAPPSKDADWEAHSIASTPLPDPNLGFLIPQEDTRPRPRSAGGSNRPTKSEEVDELVQFFETHDAPGIEQEQPIQEQNSRPYKLALGIFKAGHRRLRQFKQPKNDRWVKKETGEGRTYRYIAVPNRNSIPGNLQVEEQESEIPDDGRSTREQGFVNNGDGNENSVLWGPPFLSEITTRGEDDGNPGDHFYPGIGELPSLVGFSLASSPARDAIPAKENNSQEVITEPKNSLYNSTPPLQSEQSNPERTPARVRFDVETTGASARKTAPRYKSAKINGFEYDNDDRHEEETKDSEVSIRSSSEDAAKNSALLLQTTNDRAETTDSAVRNNLYEDGSFHTGSFESSSSAPRTKSFTHGANRSSPSPRLSPRPLKPRSSLQSIHERTTWRRPTRILQQNSSSRIFLDRPSRSHTPSSHSQQPSTSTQAGSIRPTPLFEEPLLCDDMASSLLVQPPTDLAPERVQSQYRFPDFDNDNNKSCPASSANNVPYNGSSRSPPRPAPTKPLPSLPKNKAPRSSAYNQENDTQNQSCTHLNGPQPNGETPESQTSARQGKLAKSPSRSIRRTRSALSRSHNKLHEESTLMREAVGANRSYEGDNEQTSSTSSMNEQKLSAERQERINRAERVYAVRMKDICASRARLENKMLEVREAGGDAMADEFTLSETRLLDNREAEGEAGREVGAHQLAPNPKDSMGQGEARNTNDRNAMLSTRLPTTTPSPPPKVPLPADPPLSLLGAFSIESILRGRSNPSQRHLENSPIMTVYEQWPALDGEPTKHNSVFRSNSKTCASNGRRSRQKYDSSRDTHVPQSRRDKHSNVLSRSSTILTNGKATPPRSTSPSLTSLDGEQQGQQDAIHRAPPSDHEWNTQFSHNPGYGQGTPERQVNRTMSFDPMSTISRDDYIPPLSPRARSTHIQARAAESHIPGSRHQQPRPQSQQQQQNSNTIQGLESRVAMLERQNKMLQAALMSALDVGVTLDAENVRTGTPVRTAATTDSYDFGHGPNPRPTRNSNVNPCRPNSWLSIRSAQSRRSLGATSSGSEGAGVTAIEAMIGNLEHGWSGDRQSVGVHGECNTARGQRVRYEA